MAWFKVDDKLWGHPKWLATPPRARALWVTAGSWSASQETDGVIARHVLVTLGARPADAAALVTSGLWATHRQGWRFHDWAMFQPDAASLRAKRDKESVAGEFGNHQRWHVKRDVIVPECPFCAGEDPEDVSGTRSGGDRGGESGANPPNPNPPDPYPNPRPDPPSPRLRAVGDGDQASNVTYVGRDGAPLDVWKG
jgi:hypothetical protein